MLAFSVFWIEGLVEDSTGDTIGEFRNASFDEVVDVERNGSHCNCFVTAWRLSGEI